MLYCIGLYLSFQTYCYIRLQNLLEVESQENGLIIVAYNFASLILGLQFLINNRRQLADASFVNRIFQHCHLNVSQWSELLLAGCLAT